MFHQGGGQHVNGLRSVNEKSSCWNDLSTMLEQVTIVRLILHSLPFSKLKTPDRQVNNVKNLLFPTGAL